MLGKKQHQEYRRSMAELASRKNGAHIKCIKLPITPHFDLKEYIGRIEQFNIFVRKNNGLKKLLFLFHSAGFRVFQSVAEAEHYYYEEHGNTDDFNGFPFVFVENFKIPFDSNINEEDLAFKVVLNIFNNEIYETEMPWDGKSKNPRTSGNTKKLKDFITTGGNFLSWYYGKGFKIINDSSLDELHELFGGDEDTIPYLKEIKDIVARGSKLLDLYSESSFSNYRMVVTGDLDSWISNLEKNLVQAKSDRLNPYLKQIDSVFTEKKIDELVSLAPHLKGEVDRFTNSKNDLNDLLFDYSINQDDFISKTKLIEECIQKLNGSIGSFIGQTKNLIKERRDKKLKKDFSKLANFSVKNNITATLNRYSVFSKIEDLYIEYYKDYRILVDSLTSLFHKNKDLISLDIFSSKMEFSPEKSLRYLMEQICKVSHRCSDNLRKDIFHLLKSLNVTNVEFLNKKVFERKGKFYLSEIALRKTKNQLYPFNRDFDFDPLSRKILKFALKYAADKSSKIQDVMDLREATDFFYMYTFLINILLRSGAKVVGTKNELIPPCTGVTGITNLNFYSNRLKAKETRNSMIRKCFNILLAASEERAAKLFRGKIRSRITHSSISNDKLIFLPKNKDWKVPKKALGKSGFIGAFFLGKEESIKDGCFNFYEYLSSRPKKDSFHLSPNILLQIPSMLLIDFKFGPGKSIVGSWVGKKCNQNLGKSSQLITGQTGEILIPKKLRNQVLKAILGLDNCTMGEYSLVYELEYRSSFDDDMNFKIDLVDVDAYVALPVKEDFEGVKADQVSPITKNCVIGIDINETSLAFSVVDIVKMNPLDSGKIFSNELISLKNEVRKFRKYKQVRGETKFVRKEVLGNKRNAAVGFLLSRINSLAAKYDAIPVFEKSLHQRNIGNDASIESRVINMMTYSDVKAHQTQRSHFWYNASIWKANRQNDDTTINLFPGIAVSAYRNSTTCSKCHRNAFDYVDDSGVTTDSKGAFGKGADKIILKAQNGEPLDEIDLTAKEAIGVIYRQLRSRMSNHDTSVSKFKCPFVRCGYECDADINAGTNIAYRGVQKILQSEA